MPTKTQNVNKKSNLPLSHSQTAKCKMFPFRNGFEKGLKQRCLKIAIAVTGAAQRWQRYLGSVDSRTDTRNSYSGYSAQGPRAGYGADT